MPSSVNPLEQTTVLPEITPASIAAAGTNLATATALVAGVLNVVTGADGTKGVALPANQPGQRTKVYNQSATASLLCYPAAGGTVGKGSAGIAVAIPVGTIVEFEGVDGTDWTVSVPTLAAGGTTGPVLPPSKFTASTQNGAVAAAGLLTGADFVVASMTTGANALTTRAASAMFNDIPGCTTGFSYVLRLVGGSGTCTFTAGAGVTFTGTSTVATNVFRDYVVTFSATNSCTFQSVGSGTAP